LRRVKQLLQGAELVDLNFEQKGLNFVDSEVSCFASSSVQPPGEGGLPPKVTALR